MFFTAIEQLSMALKSWEASWMLMTPPVMDRKPVTTTLTQSQDGVYRYSVHDYTNKSSNPSSALSLSGAQVKLYSGNTLLDTYYVPINQGGTLWNVFELKMGCCEKSILWNMFLIRIRLTR